MSRNFYSIEKLIIPTPSQLMEIGIPEQLIIYQLNGPGDLDILNTYLRHNLDLTFWDVSRICHFLNWITPKFYGEATCNDLETFLSRKICMEYDTLNAITEQLAYADILTSANTIIKLYHYISPAFRNEKTPDDFFLQLDYLIHTYWNVKSIRLFAKSCLDKVKQNTTPPSLTATEIQSVYHSLSSFNHRTMFLLHLQGLPIETIIKLKRNEFDANTKSISYITQNGHLNILKLPKAIHSTLTSYLVSERKVIYESDLLFTSPLNLPHSYDIPSQEFEELTTYNEFIKDIEQTLKKLGIKCFDWRAVFENTNVPKELLESTDWLLFPYDTIEPQSIGYNPRMQLYYHMFNYITPEDEDE